MRIALAAALLLVVGTLVVELSGRARRIASTNHVNPVEFSAPMPKGGTVCQPGVSLPSDAAGFRVLIGTYGRPTPAASTTFTTAAGRLVTGGYLPAGKPQGYITLPLRHPHGASTSGTLCIRFATQEQLAIGGEPFNLGPAAVQVDGKPVAGILDLVFLRPGKESWWQMLSTLDFRFGLGKSSVFGDWTLPFVAIVLAGAWLLAFRLLIRESTR